MGGADRGEPWLFLRRSLLFNDDSPGEPGDGC